MKYFLFGWRLCSTCVKYIGDLSAASSNSVIIVDQSNSPKTKNLICVMVMFVQRHWCFRYLSILKILSLLLFCFSLREHTGIIEHGTMYNDPYTRPYLRDRIRWLRSCLNELGSPNAALSLFLFLFVSPSARSWTFAHKLLYHSTNFVFL